MAAAEQPAVAAAEQPVPAIPLVQWLVSQLLPVLAIPSPQRAVSQVLRVLSVLLLQRAVSQEPLAPALGMISHRLAAVKMLCQIPGPQQV